jgi:prepilin-type N-terminal cleavage/methylation domain-containing protein
MNTKSNQKMVARTDGFTLIELMAAMVVLAVGLSAIIQLQLVTIRGTSYAQEVDQAAQLAKGVMDDLRVQALGWVNIQNGAFPTTTNFGNVFGQNVVPIASIPLPNPDDIKFTSLNALELYEGKTIASGSALSAANLINIKGDTVASTVVGGRAIYRVAYIAYPLLTQFGLPSTSAMQIVVFVSWDNKDYGDPTSDYGNWANPTEQMFLNRHMIKVPFLLVQNTI